MEIKEKAKELIDKMYNSENCGIEHFPNKHYCDCSEINLFQARQCAIICCKEILGAIPKTISVKGYGSALFENPDMNFWKDVLYELEHYQQNDK